MYMEWIYCDGGRADAGFKGTAGDCGVRAVAIATGMEYGEVYKRIGELAKEERYRDGRRSSPRTGVFRKTFHKLMEEIEWEWIPLMGIGTGCRVHMRPEELPSGRIIVSLSKHYAAVVDGVLYDTHDCTRDGTRCVYGYWRERAECDWL